MCNRGHFLIEASSRWLTPFFAKTLLRHEPKKKTLGLALRVHHCQIKVLYKMDASPGRLPLLPHQCEQEAEAKTRVSWTNYDNINKYLTNELFTINSLGKKSIINFANFKTLLNEKFRHRPAVRASLHSDRLILCLHAWPKVPRTLYLLRKLRPPRPDGSNEYFKPADDDVNQ